MTKGKIDYPEPVRHDHITVPIYVCCGKEFKGKRSYANHQQLIHGHTAKDFVEAEVIEVVEAELIT